MPRSEENSKSSQKLTMTHSSELRLDISNRLGWVIAILFLLAGMGLRFYDLTDQPLDFHGTRQLRSALIARNMYYQDQPAADPEEQALAYKLSVNTGQYEPPILERLVAWSYLLLGREILWISRIFTSLFWIIGGLALYDLTRRMTTNLAALISLGYYLFLPFAVEASRSFQPDPGMVMWVILTIYMLYRWREAQKWHWAILAGVFGGLAILTKAVAIYIVALVAIIFVLQALGLRRAWRNLQVWTMVAAMTLPTLIYYFLGRGSRAAEYISSWTISLSHLLLDPNLYLRWFGLLVELLGLAAIILAIIGISIAGARNRAVLIGLLTGYFLYGLTLPYQMATHSYYHLLLVPILALSFATVVQPVQEMVLKQSWPWKTLAVCSLLVALGFLVRTSILNFSEEDHRDAPAFWQEIGDQLPKDGKVVALTQDYGFPLAYYGWRKVTLWPIVGERQLAEMRGKGKTFEEYFLKNSRGKRYFLVTAFNQLERQPDLENYLKENYPILSEEDGYIIFDLAPPGVLTPVSPADAPTMKPIVSIITPSYNQASFLEMTIQTVLKQDYPNIEYLIVDGGSNDGSQEIIKNYSGQISWWVSERDSGQAEAINKGIVHSQGEIVAWLNSDDLYLPGTVACAVKALSENPDCSFVFGDAITIDPAGKLLNCLVFKDWRLEDLMSFRIICQPAVFMRREYLEQSGLLDLNLHFMLDHHLWLRMARLAPIIHIPAFLAAARYHPGAKNVSQAPGFGQETLQLLDWMKKDAEFSALIAANRRGVEGGAFRLNARYLLDGGQPGPALRWYGKALLASPGYALRHWHRMLYAFFSLVGLKRLAAFTANAYSDRQAKKRPDLVDLPGLGDAASTEDWPGLA